MRRNHFVILLLGLLAAGCSKKPAETHDFGFPLVYNIEVPEVPESLLKPSPPIEGDPSPAEKPSKESAKSQSPVNRGVVWSFFHPTPSKESEKPQAPAKPSLPAKDASTPPARKS